MFGIVPPGLAPEGEKRALTKVDKRCRDKLATRGFGNPKKSQSAFLNAKRSRTLIKAGMVHHAPGLLARSTAEEPKGQWKPCAINRFSKPSKAMKNPFIKEGERSISIFPFEELDKRQILRAHQMGGVSRQLK